jgi:hypothetical protein
MTDLIVVPQVDHWQRLKRLVLDSVSSPITRRVYNLGLDEFFAWYGQEPRSGFIKATVCAWRVALEARGLGTVSINVRITAVRKLAVEAADNGLLAPELAAGITRVKGVASKGVRMGNWLSVRQAQTLLNTPDITTTKGLRDRAILAVLLGCGLRRSEVAALTVPHVQQRDGRWCIVDLVGKHGRVTPELWSRIKDDFLHALPEKHRLGDFAEQICTLFGFICIDHSDWLAADEMQTAIRSLDAQGRAAVAHVVFLRLAGAGDKSEAMWTTRVAPWLDRVWPKDLTMVEPGSALNLAEAVVHTGGAFESAVQAVAPFLTPSDQYSAVVRDLEKLEYPERHPSSALQLLDRIVDIECPWPDQTLRDVLNRMLGVRPELATDARYRRIDEYLRRFNL